MIGRAECYEGLLLAMARTANKGDIYEGDIHSIEPGGKWETPSASLNES